MPPNDTVANGLRSLDMLASALAGRAVAVVAVDAGEPAWSDGHTIHVDLALPSAERTAALAVQASLVAAGSLDPGLVAGLTRKPARRYLAVEGWRALRANAYLLPGAVVAALGHPGRAPHTASAAESLEFASSRAELAEAPAIFGVIRAKEVVGRASAGGEPGRPSRRRSCPAPPRPGRAA